jgi:Uma2 family endonuclease
MGTTTTMVTVQEFLALPESDEQRQELIGGEVVCMGNAKFGHEWVKANLIELLAAWTRENRSLILFSETMVQLSHYDSPIPDISLISRSRKPTDMNHLFQGAPDLAIEVVSSEKASLLEKKIELYLTHGSKSVWVVFPEHQVVRIYDATGQARMFDRTQTIEDPAVLPGFSAPVSAIFEGL